MNKDRELLKLQIAEAESFWEEQKRLAFSGVIDRKMIALAMHRLNELHQKAINLGFRDLINPEGEEKKKTKMELFYGK